MNHPATTCESRFTARQIATVLQRSKRSILNALENIPPDGLQENRAQVWSLPALPETLRVKLAGEARRRGYAGATDLLASPPYVWEPPFPFTEAADHCQAKALKLHRALLPMFNTMDDASLSEAAREAQGVEHYRKVFGHAISTRQWRKLWKRTLERDSEAGNWQRLEIYLDDNTVRKTFAPANVTESNAKFRPIADWLSCFANPAQPTSREEASLWEEAFRLFSAQVNEGQAPKRLKRRLLEFLWKHARFLAGSFPALRKNFGRKLAKWQVDGGPALLDGREQRRGLPTAAPIIQDDLDTIIWHAAKNCGGRRAQAVRELAALGINSGLAPETRSLMDAESGSKSYVNPRLDEAIKHDVTNIRPYLQGKKAIEEATASHERDYSNLSSMQVLCADDFTWPVYFWVPDGKGWFTLTRGQCIVFIDVRSWKVLAWSLQPERNYNALIIGTLMNQICMSKGVPDFWYFERGIWKQANAIKRPVPNSWQDNASWAERKTQWAELGVRFIHATRARSKPIERVGGLLQDMMEGLKGYCGRNERLDCPDVTKNHKLEVESKRVAHPSAYFMSFDEWHSQLGQIIERYNANSQDGRVLDGKSPDQTFQQCWPLTDPPRIFDADCWHLCAHWVSERKVTEEGIKFTVLGKSYSYLNERTSQDRGKTVLAWFDPETPSFLGITDMNKKNPYVVPRKLGSDFLADLTPEGKNIYEENCALIAGHNAYPKARFTVMKEKFQMAHRANLVDPRTAATAKALAGGREQIKAQEKEESTLRRQIDNLLGKLQKQRTGVEYTPATLETLKRRAEIESRYQTETTPETIDRGKL